MESTVVLYEEDCSLRSIADALNLNPIKVRKMLITAGVYFPSTADKEKISVGAERRRRYRAVRKLRSELTEEHLWETVLLYSGVRFKTYSGYLLPMKYEKAEAANTQRNCGSIVEKTVKAWRGVQCCWH